jgi:ABC-type multidrug transport system fused ATPase/permease subunit
VDQKELGRCALLIDNMTGAVLESRGGSNNVNRCQLLSQKAGFGYNRDEIEPSMLEVFTKLGHLCMGSKAAFWVFAVVLIMLGISTYLDLEAKLLFGHVLSIESLTTNTTEHAIGSSIIARATCHSNMFIDCFSSLSSAKIGLVLGFLATKVLERVFYVTQVFIHHNAVENRNMEMKMNAFKHVLSLDQAFFDTRSTSDIRDSMDADGMNSLITWNMPYMITLSLRLVMASIFMLRINFVMGCCAIMAVLASRYLVIEPIQKREKLVHKLERKSQIMKNQVMDEAFKMIG